MDSRTINMSKSTLLIIPFVLLAGCNQKTELDTASVVEVSEEVNLEASFEGPLGLQLWSVREATATNVESALATVHGFGIREVETAGTYGMSIDDFAQALQAAGLRATSMHTGYERLRDSLDLVLDEAEVLGAQYVGTAWIPHDGPLFTNAMATEAARDLNEWGETARERGVKLFYHIHGYEFRPNADGSTPFDKMIEATDPENLTFEIDVFWVAHSGTDAAQLMRRYPDRFDLMHVKDMKKGYPTGGHSGSASSEADVPVGSGQIDYRLVLEAAEEIGLSKYYIEDESETPLTSIPKSISFLESVIY